MSKVNFQKYKSGIITIEARSLIPEKFINLLWKNGISVRNIVKKDITTLNIDISLKDYIKLKDIAKRTKTKVKIVERRGFAFFLIKVKRRNCFCNWYNIVCRYNLLFIYICMEYRNKCGS